MKISLPRDLIHDAATVAYDFWNNRFSDQREEVVQKIMSKRRWMFTRATYSREEAEAIFNLPSLSHQWGCWGGIRLNSYINKEIAKRLANGTSLAIDMRVTLTETEFNIIKPFLGVEDATTCPTE
jgi:hypothetical protein